MFDIVDANESFDELLSTGDPMADEILGLLPEHSAQVERGIVHGLSSLEAPPRALRAFLEEAERVPSWIESGTLERASAAYLAAGDLWINLALGPGSLVHTYSAASIARVLIGTGDLTRIAERRLLETASWLASCVLPGGMRHGNRGYVRTLQVRLMHARVRSSLTKRGWAGVPINQIELARTWLDFTYVPFAALRSLGIEFTPAERSDLYRFWQYVAHLLGIDERLYRPLVDDAVAARFLAVIDARLGGISDDSRALTAAMLEASAVILAQKLPFSETVMFDLVSELTRRLHGDDIADQLRVKRTRLRPVVLLFVGLNRARRRLERRSARLERAAMRSAQVALEDVLVEVGATAFEEQLRSPSSKRGGQAASDVSAGAGARAGLGES